MGSRHIRGVRFQAISGDHPGASVPHVHAYVGSGQVLVELLPWGEVRVSKAHRSSIRGIISLSEERHVLLIAKSAYDELMALWRMSQS
jgi:hypothetical protein